jgi:hypothetical protein
MDEHLPPLRAQCGERLHIVHIDVTAEAGLDIYRAAIQHYQLPRERLGVPALAIGERVLVGSLEIPGELPGIVATGLASVGIDWPPLAGLRDFIAAAGGARSLRAR